MVSNSLNRNTDEIDKVRRALGNRCAGTFDCMPAHAPRGAVIEATEAARAADADLIVTIGGGSITDGGKAVQMCLANDIRSPEAIDKLRPVKGSDGIVGPPPMNPPTVRQISVPTTLSAGDFSALAGVTDERTKVKELLRHPRIMPSAVVLDPAIALHTPEWLWLSTGIRAVDHCVEGVCSNEAHVFGDAQALKGLALLASGLPRVKADPKDLAARLDCQSGAWLSMGPLSSSSRPHHIEHDSVTRKVMSPLRAMMSAKIGRTGFSKSPKQANVYTAAADKKRLAAGAAKLIAGDRIANTDCPTAIAPPELLKGKSNA